MPKNATQAVTPLTIFSILAHKAANSNDPLTLIPYGELEQRVKYRLKGFLTDPHRSRSVSRGMRAFEPYNILKTEQRDDRDPLVGITINSSLPAPYSYLGILIFLDDLARKETGIVSGLKDVGIVDNESEMTFDIIEETENILYYWIEEKSGKLLKGIQDSKEVLIGSLFRKVAREGSTKYSGAKIFYSMSPIERILLVLSNLGIQLRKIDGSKEELVPYIVAKFLLLCAAAAVDKWIALRLKEIRFEESISNFRNIPFLRTQLLAHKGRLPIKIKEKFNLAERKE